VSQIFFGNAICEIKRDVPLEVKTSKCICGTLPGYQPGKMIIKETFPFSKIFFQSILIN